MKKKAFGIAVIFGVVVFSAAAQAEDQWCKAAEGPTKTKDEMVSMLAGKGYDVKGTGTEHGCFEVKAIGPDGKRVEVYLDPATGNIVREKK